MVHIAYLKKKDRQKNGYTYYGAEYKYGVYFKDRLIRPALNLLEASFIMERIVIDRTMNPQNFNFSHHG